jgi:hypothetical protein
MKNEIAFSLINRPRMTYSELLERMHYYLGTNPELKNALVTDIWVEEDKTSIYEGAIVMQLYDPVEYLDGTLTIPVDKAVQAN